MLSCKLNSFMVMMVSRLLLAIGGFHLLLDWSFRLEVSLSGPVLDLSVATFESFLKSFFKRKNW